MNKLNCECNDGSKFENNECSCQCHVHFKEVENLILGAFLYNKTDNQIIINLNDIDCPHPTCQEHYGKGK